MRMPELRRIVEAAGGVILELVSIAGILVILCGGLWYYFFCVPYRTFTDCRGRDIDVAQMKIWEEQEKENYSDILSMAGWRTEKMETVWSVSTGRRSLTGVVGVYGDASLVYPAKILAGDYALSVWDDGNYAPARNDENHELSAREGGRPQKGRRDCVLTGELSDDLFGSTDTAGELIQTEDEILVVQGVIDREGKWLLKPVSDGPVEYVSFRMSRRYQAEEKARQMTGVR